MSSGQILDKISHIFRVFKYFQVYLCVLDIFWARPESNPIRNQTERTYKL